MSQCASDQQKACPGCRNVLAGYLCYASSKQYSTQQSTDHCASNCSTGLERSDVQVKRACSWPTQGNLTEAKTGRSGHPDSVVHRHVRCSAVTEYTQTADLKRTAPLCSDCFGSNAGNRSPSVRCETTISSAVPFQILLINLKSRARLLTTKLQAIATSDSSKSCDKAAMAPKRKAAGEKAPESKKPRKDAAATATAKKPDSEAEIWFSVEHW